MRDFTFFWMFGRQFAVQWRPIRWVGFKWIDTPNWRHAGCVYLGCFKFLW